jgi:DNA-directed RNA polymerase specialized sigma24 family protein
MTAPEALPVEAILAHTDALYNHGRHLTGDDAEAEHLVQETALRALANAREYRPGKLKAWHCPGRGARRLSRAAASWPSRRGRFTVLLWRDGDLGYALVSDVARPELETLVGKISPAP